MQARNIVSRALGIQPLAWLGDLSYGWYLWHWPAIMFATALFPGSATAKAAALGSLLPAWASFRWIERPFIERRRGQAAWRIALVSTLLPVAAFCGLAVASPRLESLPEIAKWRAIQLTHFDNTRGCDSSGLLSSRPPACSLVRHDARYRVVLIGDSQAGQFAEPAIAATAEVPANLLVATFPGCPFADVVVYYSGVVTSDCRRFVTRAVQALRRDRPALVIIATWSAGYIGSSQVRLQSVTGGPKLTNRGERKQLFQRGLSRVVHALTTAGIRVMLVHQIPQFGDWEPARCAMARILLSVCSDSIPTSNELASLQPSFEAEDAAVGHERLATTINFGQQLCSRSSCSTLRAGTFLYRDSAHLSVIGTSLLTSALTTAIRRELHKARD
jgi:hypothetical protein